MDKFHTEISSHMFVENFSPLTAAIGEDFRQLEIRARKVQNRGHRKQAA